MKSFCKIASLMALVAVFLGLMVTGCSEGDNTLAAATGTTLVGKIEIQTGDKSVCPEGTDFVAMGLVKNGAWIKDSSGNEVVGYYSNDEKDHAGYTTEKWTGNNPYVMTLKVPDDVVTANPQANVAVIAANQYGLPIAYYYDTVALAKNTRAAFDCTEKEITTIDVKANFGVVGISEGVWKVAKGETKEVKAAITIVNQNNDVVYTWVIDDDVALEDVTKTGNIEVSTEEPQIKGVAINDGKDEVKVKYVYNVGGEPLTCNINVTVYGVIVNLTCDEGKFPAFDEGEYITIDTIKINDDDPQEVGLIWNNESESQDYYALEDYPVGIGDKVTVAVTMVDKDDASYAGAVEPLEVKTSEFDANFMYVTNWVPLMTQAKIILDCSATEMTADKFPLTIKWTYDNESQEDVKFDAPTEEGTYEIGVVEAGPTVVIESVDANDGTAASFDSYNSYTFDVTEAGENVAPVTDWAM